MIQKNILLLDDDPRILRTLKLQLSMHQYNVFLAENYCEALTILAKNDIQVVISDHRMPDMTGAEFLSIVKVKYPHTIRMILSGYADFEAVSDAINRGAIYKFINKPWYQDALLEIIREAFEQYTKGVNKDSADRVFSKSIEAIIITDNDGNVERLNTSFSLFFEKDNKHYKKRGFNISHLIDDQTEVTEINHAIHHSGYWNGQITVTSKANVKNTYNLNVSLIKDDNDCPRRIVYMFNQLENSDISNAVPPLASKETLVSMDTFSKQVELRTMNSANAQRKFAVLKLSFENLETIRNIHGLCTTNNILQSAAIKIQKITANTSIIAHNDDHCLYILVDKTESETSLSDILSHLQEVFDHPIYVNSDKYYLQAQVFSIVFPSDGKKSNILMQKLHEKETNEPQKVIAQPFGINDIEKSLFSNDFNVLYEPVADMRTKQNKCFQVHYIWMHPEHGRLKDTDYIPHISNVETNLEITEVLFERFIEDAKQILQTAKETNFYVPLNLSLINNEDYISSICTSSLTHNEISKHIHFILPEHALLEKNNDIESLVYQLNERGFKVVIDDFGGTLASLNWLSKMDVKALILNRYLSSSWPYDQKSHQLVKSILSSCKVFSVDCILPQEGHKLEILSHLSKEGLLYKDVSQGMLHKEDIVNNSSTFNKKLTG